MNMEKMWTVRQLISQLLFYPMDAKICIQCSEDGDVLDMCKVDFIAQDHDDDSCESFIVLQDAAL